MAKTKQSKKKTKTKTRSKTTITTKIDREATRRKILAERFLSERILEAVKDEIAELAEVLETVPVLREMNDVVQDIYRSSSTALESRRSNLYVHLHNDPVGWTALRHFNVLLHDQLSQPGKEFAKETFYPTRNIDDAIGAIIRAVRWRLYRLEALIEVMKKQKPRQ